MNTQVSDVGKGLCHRIDVNTAAPADDKILDQRRISDFSGREHFNFDGVEPFAFFEVENGMRIGAAVEGQFFQVLERQWESFIPPL